jgi:hypothetical protein
MDTVKEGFGGERRPKDRVTLQIILVFTLSHLKPFTQGRVSVCDKYLHWPHVSVLIKTCEITIVLVKVGIVQCPPIAHVQ